MRPDDAELPTLLCSEPPQPVVAELWREHDQDIRHAPGMYLGVRKLVPGVGVAQRLYGDGARCVDLPELVDLADIGQLSGAISAISLIRDFTSLGIKVRWRARLYTEGSWQWLSHLWPPEELLGINDRGAASEWLRTHYVGKCFFRRGPGFIQVRDRRHGHLARFTIDEHDYIESIPRLLYGGSTNSIAPHVLASYGNEHLVLHLRDRAVWLPYQVRRWPRPSIVV